jgi:hypothetical protein
VDGLRGDLWCLRFLGETPDLRAVEVPGLLSNVLRGE